MDEPDEGPDADAPAAENAPADPDWLQAVDELEAAHRRLEARGWHPTLTGSLSRRLGDGRIAILSGDGSGAAQPPGGIDLQGRPTGGGASGADAVLHGQIYRELLPEGAVLHGHSVAATALSLGDPADRIRFSGYAMQTLFDREAGAAGTLVLPIFENDPDPARMVATISRTLAECSMGYMVRGGGLYVWARSMQGALARLDGLGFLLACALERRKLA